MQSITMYEKNSDVVLEQFVLNHLDLVKKIATQIKRKLPSHIEFDDLLQSGLIGLLEARKNYNPEMGASFETYATIRIRGAIIDSLRKNSWISRDIIKKMKKVSDAINKIEKRNKQQATLENIIMELNITHEEYFKISQEINMFYVANLADKHVEHSLADDSNDPERIAQKDAVKTQLKEILKLLPEKEQLVLSLYYVEELTFKQIGEVLELTEARISQLHSIAIARIRAKMRSE
ncbi:sigma-70 family RNA polymerase sigma factor [Aquicella lusitana]|uniref:RNA polymerase sigma-28 (SigD/FliA/WhiG) subunit n=1 Tax=Aquicella lusitana TaxID=254246 RepID=A0A370G5Q0_9COXI|nr:FliA/WhiG family RNA polymerase sigma factor [Aquicella lusitana]RDI38540.1 RNA polymerase sigma-28 (SigD/FliA/WhiG) subunit [Aquicella lusitana]VVC74615.1 RNA polymerase sigma factor FliA [Aquicella lusitana]